MTFTHITVIYLLFMFLLTVRPLGSGAFGQVFLAHAVGIVAFDPRGSTKRKSGRRRSRFGSTSRPYVNDKRVTQVAVKSLKGKFINLHLQKNIERRRTPPLRWKLALSVVGEGDFKMFSTPPTLVKRSF